MEEYIVTEETINDVKKKINEDIIKYDEKTILKNLGYFADASTSIANLLKDYIDDIWEIDFKEDLPIYSLNERIKFVKDFYKGINTNIDIDSLINNGTIDFMGDNYCEEIDKVRTHKPKVSGYNFYEFDTKFTTIDVENTGYFSDSIVLTHELSHYREKENMVNKSPIGYLLTEALADAEQFIFCDYYKENHKKEVDTFLAYRLKVYYYHSCDCAEFLIPYYFYYNYSDVSKKLYTEQFGEEYKDEFYENIVNFCEINKELKTVQYLMASMLSPYLLKKYKEDKNFIKVLNELHENAAKYESLEEVYKLLGLSTNLYSARNELIFALKDMTEELLNKNVLRKVK